VKDDLASWYEKTGVDFLGKIGIKKGYTILDFGCGRGHYTVPVSKLVGNIGVVYALDNNKSVLNELKKTMEGKDIRNVKLISSIKDPSLEDNSVDIVLCYDVLHYMNLSSRKNVYNGIRRVLKNNALFSVYPKHCKGNFPLRELVNVSVGEIIKEVQDSGFVLSRKIKSKLLHDGHFEKGSILNFRKGE
jgi:ubiquinone/menaquinone biosynthesis C-methylase UbiE